MEKKQTKIRYAVVGLGHIAQVAVIPAFTQTENSELVALISSDREKLHSLSEKYNVEHVGNYEDFEDCLLRSKAHAVYIALPNSLHKEFTLRAAKLGIHVLCEKPLATKKDDCDQMIHAAEQANIKLMTAYRLHFDAANLEAIQIAQSGQLGDLRFFHSTFSYQIQDDENIRLDHDLGGGPIYDLGVYCINAARYIFQDEPVEVVACLASAPTDDRFAEVEEMASVILKFPENRMASFTVSFGVEATSFFEVLGSKGKLRVENAYEYKEALSHELTIDGETTKKKFERTDQFAPELKYFSDCILENRGVEPSGLEGRNDVEIVEAIFESHRTGQKIPLNLEPDHLKPQVSQKMFYPPVREIDSVNARGASES